ncbi:DUF2292 domain-containing protein [Streptococcus pneumoniae]|uniref:DUF2292 domain-containing protein n=1 Tax=Streptococcus pneumoniae TaxID=1313 RepID=UPI0021178E93|nr:DUF2292 domain-containing protein [Streptococcus pneumoniae]
MLNIWNQKREEKQMNPNKDYTPFLQDNFIIFNKDGIIEMRKIPDFGSVVFTSQDGNIVQIETTIKER